MDAWKKAETDLALSMKWQAQGSLTQMNFLISQRGNIPAGESRTSAVSKSGVNAVRGNREQEI